MKESYKYFEENGLKIFFSLGFFQKTDQNANKQTKNRPKKTKSLLNRPKSVKTDRLSSTEIGTLPEGL